LGITQSFRSYRRYNKSLYFKCEDVEKGLKHQYNDNKAYNNNENELKTSCNNLLQDNTFEESQSSVYTRRALKAVASLIVILVASFIAYTMENIYYTILAIFIALVSIIFITGKWRWFYIAAVTAKRDVT
jgi:magnesium-transporting ATPase (P-type)